MLSITFFFRLTALSDVSVSLQSVKDDIRETAYENSGSQALEPLKVLEPNQIKDRESCELTDESIICCDGFAKPEKGKDIGSELYGNSDSDLKVPRNVQDTDTPGIESNECSSKLQQSSDQSALTCDQNASKRVETEIDHFNKIDVCEEICENSPEDRIETTRAEIFREHLTSNDVTSEAGETTEVENKKMEKLQIDENLSKSSEHQRKNYQTPSKPLSFISRCENAINPQVMAIDFAPEIEVNASSDLRNVPPYGNLGSEDAFPLSPKLRDEQPEVEQPESAEDTKVMVLENNDTKEVGKRIPSYEEGTVESEDEDDEDRGMMLKKVNEPAKVKKKNSKTFAFQVGTDIFDLGLDNSKLYCGVVICLKDRGKSQFYPGKSTKLDTERGTLSMISYVPNDDFFNEETFSYYYAVCQSDDTNVLGTLPDAVRASQNNQRTESTKEVQYIDDSNLMQIFKISTTNVAVEKTDEVVNENGIAEVRSGSQTPKSVNVSGSHDTSKSGPVSMAVQDDQNRSVDSYQKKQPASEYNNRKSETGVKDIFANVKDGNCPSKKETKWSFLFRVGPEISQLGLGETVYCGVVIITKEQRKETFDFYPGVKKDDAQPNSLLLEVNLTEKDITVQKYFKYAYAISSSAAKTTYATDNSKICLSDVIKEVKIKKEFKTIDDTEETLSFKSGKKKDSQSQTSHAMKTRSKTEQKLESEKIDPAQSTKDAESDISSTSNLNISQESFVNPNEKNGSSALKDIIVNSRTESTVRGSLLELNAIVGDDVCTVMKNKKCKICVATSVDNFQRLTPGFVFAELNGKLWIRFKLDLRDNSFVQYKYVVACNEADDKEKWNWETLHREGFINRKVGMSDSEDNQPRQQLLKYDGVIMFSRAPENWKGKVNSFLNGVKSAFGFSDDMKFYAQQNLSGLELYVHHLIEDFCALVDGEKFLLEMKRLLHTISYTRCGLKNETNSKVVPLSAEELLQLCVKKLLLYYNTRNCKEYGEQLDSVENHIILAGVFLLMSLSKKNSALFRNITIESLEEFLCVAKFSSSEFREAVRQKLTSVDASFIVIKVQEVCLRLLQCDATKKTNKLSVFFDWMAFNEDKNRSVIYPAWWSRAHC